MQLLRKSLPGILMKIDLLSSPITFLYYSRPSLSYDPDFLSKSILFICLYINQLSFLIHYNGCFHSMSN